MSKKKKIRSTAPVHLRGKPLTLQENYDLAIDLLQKLLKSYCTAKERYTGTQDVYDLQIANRQAVKARLSRYTELRRLIGVVLHLDDLSEHMGILDIAPHSLVEQLLGTAQWSTPVADALSLSEMILKSQLKKNPSFRPPSRHIEILQSVKDWLDSPDKSTEYQKATEALKSVYPVFLNYEGVRETAPDHDEVRMRDCMSVVAMAHMALDSRFQTAVKKRQQAKMAGISHEMTA